MYRVLLIDDEPNILNALRRCLAGIDAGELDGEALQVETFTSPEAAIERSEEQDFDLMISDYRMPSMNGVDVLSRLMEIQPAASRVIISGYADRDAIIAAINEAHLTRFIEKPWNDHELRSTIVSILVRTGSGAHRVDRDASTESDRQLRRLEEDCPGITQVERADDGGIIIGPDEWEE